MIRTKNNIKDIFAMAKIIKSLNGVASGHLMARHFVHMPVNEFLNAVEVLLRSGVVVRHKNGYMLMYAGSDL